MNESMKRTIFLCLFVFFSCGLIIAQEDSVVVQENICPEFSFLDRDSCIINVNSFRGKILVITFWTTWNGQCREQMPYLTSFKKKFKKEPINFLNVSLDDNKKLWETYLKKHYIVGTHLYSGRSRDLIKQFEITTIPRTVVLDENGIIIEKNVPLSEKNDELKAVIDGVIHRRTINKSNKIE